MRDLLGICSRDRCEGIFQVLLDLDFVCSRFAIWSFGCGLSGSDRSDQSGRGSRVFKSPLLQVVGFESLESFSVVPSPFPLLQVRAKVSNAKEG